MTTDLFCLFANFLTDSFDELRIPGRTIVQSRRKQGCPFDHQPDQTFLVRHGRYAKSGFLDKELLQSVKGAYPFFGIYRVRAKRAGDLPYPKLKLLFQIIRGRSLSEGIGTD